MVVANLYRVMWANCCGAEFSEQGDSVVEWTVLRYISDGLAFV